MLALHLLPNAPEKAPALICLHGFLGCAQDWLPLTEPLSALGPLLCVDLPGHGASTPLVAQTWDETIDALVLEIRQKDLPPLPLLGYSMGGRLALHLALRHPELFTALILESASPGLRHEEEREQRYLQDCRLAARLEGEPLDYSAFLQEWYSQPVFNTLPRDPLALQQLVEKRASSPPPHPGQALRLMSVGAQPGLWEALPSLALPTLLLVGEEDRKYRHIAESMAELSPRVAVEVFANCSHNVHLENPTGYTTVLRRFLEAVR